MFMAPAMPFFDDASRKASRHAKCGETKEQGNSEFSHERLQALLLWIENGATTLSIPQSSWRLAMAIGATPR
jgi:hypothetical protein